MRIVVLGAGRTGRGFLGRLFYKQADLTFIDRDEELVKKLKNAGKFFVRYFDGSPETIVTGFCALCTTSPACETALRNADAVFVSVGGENGKAAGEWLSRFIRNDRCVVACENAAIPASTLGGGFSETASSGAVFCTTVEDGEIDIRSESYPFLHVSARGLTPPVSVLSGLCIEPDFDTLMLRKIYTYNAASAMIAYLGAQKSIHEFSEAANDPEISAWLDVFYREINRAICAEYGISPAEQQTFAQFSKAKFQNRDISDSILRNASTPRRKLSPTERIIAPLNLILKFGGDPGPLVLTAAAALHYLGVLSEADAKTALETVCGLAPDEPLYRLILDGFLKKETAF